MNRLFATALASALVVVVAVDNCHFDSGRGATFDLSPLQHAGAYRVHDSIHASERDYTYVFNVCGNTSEIPGTGPLGAGNGCQSTHGTGLHSADPPLTGPAPAFQVKATDSNECFRLGHSPEDVEWGLIEPEDPSRGVTLRYKNGNKCGNDNPRELQLNFECRDDAFNIPDDEPVVEDHCVYELSLTTVYGCPLECGVTQSSEGRHVCNRKGVCRYDTGIKKAKCFCSDGWTGNDCSVEVDASKGSSLSGVLVTCSILLVVTLGGIALVWKKVRGLRLDPQAYNQMAGDDEGSTDRIDTSAL